MPQQIKSVLEIGEFIKIMLEKKKIFFFLLRIDGRCGRGGGGGGGETIYNSSLKALNQSE